MILNAMISKVCKGPKFKYMLTLISLLFLTCIWNLQSDPEHSAQAWLQYTRLIHETLRKIAWSKQCQNTVSKDIYENLFPSSSNKYFMSIWKNYCGGIGNQMFRYASLYGIGKPYGRIPAYTIDQNCHKLGSQGHDSEGKDEIQKLFPIYASQLKYKDMTNYEQETFNLNGFAQHCCSYDDPKRANFNDIHQKFVNIHGAVFIQHYKFFHHRRKEIRQIFQFGNAICSEVATFKQELFGADAYHKFCVHARRGDFNADTDPDHSPTEKIFTEKAISFVYNELKQKYESISVVLLGEDKAFLSNLSVDKMGITGELELEFTEHFTHFSHVYLPKAMPRANDLVFATTDCDSFLITASASTFSWWIGYLMPDGATVYYNFMNRGPYVHDNFLPEWTPIKMDKNGTITRVL